MWKKLVQGFLFGAGFAIGAALLWTIWVVWVWPAMFSSPSLFAHSTESTTSQVPTIVERQRFLGSGGRFAGDFPMHDAKSLLGGDATLQGTILADGKPATGLRLRLALNGSVLSQWGEVDARGQYRISVPAGKYRIDGYELDSSSADKVLANLIDSPNNEHDRPSFSLGATETVEATSLHYVKPVIIESPVGEIRVTNDTVIRWQAYPGASQYRIQVEEALTLKNFSNRSMLFTWEERPLTGETEFRLGKNASRIQSGKQYFVHIQALDIDGQVISESANKFGNHHFKAI